MTEGNGVGGAVPTEFGKLDSSEAMWMSKLNLGVVLNDTLMFFHS